MVLFIKTLTSRLQDVQYLPLQIPILRKILQVEGKDHIRDNRRPGFGSGEDLSTTTSGLRKTSVCIFIRFVKRA